ncbi:MULTISPECIES: hypothetical protein [Streptomyces]|uniref:hypothetical protein n=1 Tax=Streptomyces TaxID=1883 RepID=UPI0004C1A36E|nr:MULTISPECIES: hypothetical protein [Streptomyces]
MDTLHHGDPAQLLAATEGLLARTRTRLRGAGVPLLTFGLLSLAAAPIAGQAYNFGANGRSVESYPAFAYAQLTGLCVAHAPDAACDAHEFDGAVLRFLGWGIWFALLPLAWLALARWYRRRGEARGIVPHRTAWIGATAGAGALVAAVLLALLLSDRTPFTLSLLANAYASPWYVIGIGLLVLGLTERSPLVAGAGLAHTALLTAYLAAPWESGWLPWLDRSDGGWADGPQPKALLLAAILLAAGLAQWTATRRQPAPSRTVTP